MPKPPRRKKPPDWGGLGSLGSTIQKAAGQLAKPKPKPPPRKKLTTPEKHHLSTLAADLTPTIGDIADRAVARQKKTPKDLTPEFPGGSALGLLKRDRVAPAPYKPGFKPPPDLKRKAKIEEIRYKLAQAKPFVPGAGELLNATRPHDIPDAFAPSPGIDLGQIARAAQAELTHPSRIDRFFSDIVPGYSYGDLWGDIKTANNYAAHVLTLGIEPHSQDWSDQWTSQALEKLGIPNAQLPTMIQIIDKSQKVADDIINNASEAFNYDPSRLHSGFGQGAPIEAQGYTAPVQSIMSGARAVARNTLEIAFGMAPGMIYAALHPVRAAEEMGVFYERFYGPLLNGDLSLFMENVKRYPLQLPLDLIPFVQVIAAPIKGSQAAMAGLRAARAGETVVTKGGRVVPVTRGQAITRGMLFRQVPREVMGENRWSRPPTIRMFERPTTVESAGKDATVVMKDTDGKVTRAKVKDNPELQGTDLLNSDHSPTTLEFKGKHQEVTDIVEKRPVVQRYAPRSAAGEVLSDAYWFARGHISKSARHKVTEQIEQEKANRFSKINQFKAATKEIKTREEQTAFDRMLVYGESAPEATRAEIKKRETELGDSPAQIRETEILKSALPHIDNPSPYLQKAVTMGRDISRQTEEMLVRLGWLTPTAAKNMIRSQIAWTTERPKIRSFRRDEIQASLVEAGMAPERAAVAMEMLDQQAYAYGRLRGVDPSYWYKRAFAGSEAITREDLAVMLQGDHLVASDRGGANHFSSEAEKVTQAEALDGVDLSVFTKNQRARIRRSLGKIPQAIQDGWIGRNWYKEASTEILMQSAGNLDKADMLAQLTAIYSANTRAGLDLDAAVAALREYELKKTVSVGTGAKRKKALAVLQGKEWAGLKTNRFYLNMLRGIDRDKYEALMVGDHPVTIDLHMMNFFGFKPSEHQFAVNTPARYEALSRIVRNVAHEIGMDPEDLQAVLWTHQRVIHGEPLLASSSTYARHLREGGARIPFEIAPGDAAALDSYLNLAPDVREAFHSEVLGAINDYLRGVGWGGYIEARGAGYWEGHSNAAWTIIAPAFSRIGRFTGEAGIATTPETIARIEQIAADLAVSLNQDAVGYFLTKHTPSIPNGARNGAVVNLGRAITDEEILTIHQLMESKGHQYFALPPSPEGAYALTFENHTAPLTAEQVRENTAFNKKFQQDLVDTLEQVYPDDQVDLHPIAHLGNLLEDASLRKAATSARSPDLRRAADSLSESTREIYGRYLGEDSAQAVESAPQKILASMREDPKVVEQDAYPVAAIRREAVGPGQIYFAKDYVDFAAVTHEAAHANFPIVFEAMTNTNDVRIPAFERAVDIDLSKPLHVSDEEFLARLTEAWIWNGRTPAAHMRSILANASEEMKDIYKRGISQIARDAEEEVRIRSALQDSSVSSVLADMFDYAIGAEADPQAVFVTRQRMGAFGKMGNRVRTFMKNSGFMSRERMRPQVRKGSKMTRFESGEYTRGPEPVVKYAAEAVRNQFQAETADIIWNDHSIPVRLVAGHPVPQPGYEMVVGTKLRGALTQMDEAARERARAVGETEDRYLDMEPQQFFHEVLGDAQSAVQNAKPSMSNELLVQGIRDGEIRQVPTDILHAYVNATAGAWSLSRIGILGDTIKATLNLFNMRARWSMIMKPAYPILNTASSLALGFLNQGIFQPMNLRHALNFMSDWSPETLAWIDSIEGSSAALAGLSDVRPRSGIEGVIGAEQSVFQKAMHTMSGPERRVRRAGLAHEFRRYGLRTEEDLIQFRDLVDKHPESYGRDLNAMIRYAEESMIRFRGMSPVEQNIVRNAFFVYGWLRAATRFTIFFPLNKPFTAAALAAFGEYGWEQMKESLDQLPMPAAGWMPLGKEKQVGDEWVQHAIDLSPILPFSQAGLTADALFGSFQGDAVENLSTLLSPGADTAFTMLFGTDKYGKNLGDAWNDLTNWRNLPLIAWAARFVDPALTGTKMKMPLDHRGVAMLFMFGMAADRDIKEHMAYDSWMQSLPPTFRTAIASMQHTFQTAMEADAAFKKAGYEGLPEDLGKALFAYDAANIYSSFKLAELNKQQVSPSGYQAKLKGLPAAAKAQMKWEILARFYPEADTYLKSIAATLDPKNPADVAQMNQSVDDQWQTFVGDSVSDINSILSDTYGTSKTKWRPSRINRSKWLLHIMETASPDIFDSVLRQTKEQGLSLSDSNDWHQIAQIVEKEYERMPR